MKNNKKRRKTCFTIAARRALQSRRLNGNLLQVAWVYFAHLLSLPSLFRFPELPSRGKNLDTLYISDYERGYATTSIAGEARPPAGPTIRKLLRDLRRPSRSRVAAIELATRIDDSALREWVGDKIQNDKTSLMAIASRPGLSDEAILATWNLLMDQDRAHLRERADDETSTFENRRKWV